MLSAKARNLMVDIGNLAQSHAHWCQRKEEAEKATALAIAEIARHEAKARGLAEQLTQALREVE